MEKLLKKIGSDDEVPKDIPSSSSTAATKKRKKRQSSDNSIPTEIITTSPILSETASTPTSASSPSVRDPKRGKIVRYHGSSSGYYLVGNILDSSQQEEELAQDVDEVERSQKVYVVPSFNGGENFRLRRMNVDDDDLMVVRDTTAAEEAFQQADDDQETIDDIIPLSVLTKLVHT